MTNMPPFRDLSRRDNLDYWNGTGPCSPSRYVTERPPPRGPDLEIGHFSIPWRWTDRRFDG